jgi:hypothetical protein
LASSCLLCGHEGLMWAVCVFDEFGFLED